jgi:hypothetical protein
LLLHNLVDGRQFGLETSRADSEILGVKNGAVFYRIDDAIYKAKIENGWTHDPTLLVKDDNVPHVHWLFWSTKSEATEKPVGTR